MARANHVVCVKENCKVEIHKDLAVKTDGVCPKCSGMSQQKTNKGEVKMNNTNKVIGMEYVPGKALVIEGGKKEQVTYHAAVKMTIVNGAVEQQVTFGYSPMGGQKMFYRSNGGAIMEMSRADFVKNLKQIKVANFEQVSKMLNGIRYVKKDNHIVGKCDCCKEELVTAANMDFVQKEVNRARIEKETGIKTHMFSKICYKCQGAGPRPVKESKVQAKAPKVEAGDHPNCHKCGKEVKSQKVVEYSLKKHGVVLCFHPCQKNYKPETEPVTEAQKKRVEKAMEYMLSNQEAPQNEGSTPDNNEESSVESPAFSGLTPEMIAEIMALNVDPYSALAELQRELAESHFENSQDQAKLWDNLHASHVAKVCSTCKKSPCVCGKGASEASGTINTEHTATTEKKEEAGYSRSSQDLCLICVSELPAYDVWKYDMCPECTANPSDIIEKIYEIPAHIKDEAKRYLEGASNASATPEVAPVVETEAKHEDFMSSISIGLSDEDAPAEYESDELPF